jgi:RNA polymerase sigma factor (sigma-70 family)
MKITDEQLVEAICSPDPAKRDWAIYQFYADASLRESIIRYVVRNGGNEEDGQDVFQEAICLLDRNVRAGKFNYKSKLSTYLFSIAKWYWVSYRRKHRKFEELEYPAVENEVDPFEDRLQPEELKKLLDLAIQELGERCQKLLGYYKLDYSMQEIKEYLGFSSPAMARKEAYRCRERLRKVFLSNPDLLKALNIKI